MPSKITQRLQNYKASERKCFFLSVILISIILSISLCFILLFLTFSLDQLPTIMDHFVYHNILLEMKKYSIGKADRLMKDVSIDKEFVDLLSKHFTSRPKILQF